MTKPSLLFDACSILMLVRELKGEASDKLVEGSTISLVYYELGNALWRECFLLKRISQEEARTLLRSMYAIVGQMELLSIGHEDEANAILDLACNHSLTFYDSAYLAQAIKSNKTLVTEDKKLSKAAEKAGVKTLTITTFLH
jgi:predicted nucleic acid-binding protein